MLEGETESKPAKTAPAKLTAEPEVVSTEAEAGLESEAKEIKAQARKSWTPGGEPPNPTAAVGI